MQTQVERRPFDVNTIIDAPSLETEIQTLVSGGSRPIPTPSLRRDRDRRDRKADEPAREDVEQMETQARQPDVGQAQPSTDSISAILAERGKTHGDFTDNARVMQALKNTVMFDRDGVGWAALTDVQREGLHMILHKVGRIISGNPNTRDHWDDIAGYAKLVSERING